MSMKTLALAAVLGLPLPGEGGEIRLHLPGGLPGELLSRCAPVPCLIQRSLQSADDEAANVGSVAEPDFGLGRVNVDIDLGRRHLDEQGGDRVPVPREQVAVGGA